MNLLAVVTPLSIYHDCSTRKVFWEEKFTGEENFTLGYFAAVSMKNCFRRNVKKHREIKVSDKYVTLDVPLKFDSLYKSRITSSESKVNLGRSGKGLITSLVIKAKIMPKKYKKARYSTRNVSKKDLSKIIREFEKVYYKSYGRRRPKYDPTDSYLYPARHLLKCMMRANDRNSNN